MIECQFDGNTALFISKGYAALSDLLKKITFFFKAQGEHIYFDTKHTQTNNEPLLLLLITGTLNKAIKAKR